MQDWYGTWKKESLNYFVTPKPDFPEEYWEVFSEIPHFTTTTFRPFVPNIGEDQIDYLHDKGEKL